MDNKLKGIFFIIFLILSLILTIFLILFPYWYVILIFLICVIFGIIFAYLTFEKKEPNTLKDSLKLYKQKESILEQKTNLQKQYLKRKITESQFVNEVQELDEKIFYLDFSLYFVQKKFESQEKLKKQLEFLQKQYFKNLINEQLYYKIQSDLSKELSKEISKIKK
jgi:hypothetical protein